MNQTASPAQRRDCQSSSEALSALPESPTLQRACVQSGKLWMVKVKGQPDRHLHVLSTLLSAVRSTCCCTGLGIYNQRIYNQAVWMPRQQATVVETLAVKSALVDV